MEEFQIDGVNGDQLLVRQLPDQVDRRSGVVRISIAERGAHGSSSATLSPAELDDLLAGLRSLALSLRRNRGR